MADAFGNALGQALAPSSNVGSQQVNARSEWLDQQINQALSGNAAGDAPWGVNEQVRHLVILSADGNDPEADRYSRLAELEYLSERAAASGEMTVFDRQDAEFGGRSVGSPYAMDEALTLQHLKGRADAWAVVKDQIAERNAMLQAQDAQAATARSQREADNVASWRELEAQARSGGSAAASTGNAMFVSEGGAAFGNRQMSIRERTQTNDPEWRQAVTSGFRGETQSVMASHNEREAAKLGGLLRFGFDMTPVGAGYNYVENAAEGRPFSAILSIAPYAIPGGILAAGAERSALRAMDDVASSERQILNLRSVSAEQVNASFVEQGLKAPYLQTVRPREFSAASDLNFVRLHGPTNQEGVWMVRAGEIEGMSAAQIQSHLGLKYAPTQISPVTILQGAEMRVGRVGPQLHWGAPSPQGIQYELFNLSKTKFGQPRPLQ